MSECIFCKIVAGTIPCARVYEDDAVLAFLDIGPLNPGHTLVVPKEHFATLPELPDALASATAAVVPRICRAVQAATSAEGLNVVVNVGRVAGQTVDHVHWHVIPRHGGDALRWPWPAGRCEPEEMERLRKEVASRVGVV